MTGRVSGHVRHDRACRKGAAAAEAAAGKEATVAVRDAARELLVRAARTGEPGASRKPRSRASSSSAIAAAGDTGAGKGSWSSSARAAGGWQASLPRRGTTCRTSLACGAANQRGRRCAAACGARTRHELPAYTFYVCATFTVQRAANADNSRYQASSSAPSPAPA
jgi:hypothetical protein